VIVRTKAGVRFDTLAPAGFRILGAIERAARAHDTVLVITSGTDGTHAKGSKHYTGEAFDVRSKTLTAQEKRGVLRSIMLDLAEDDRDPPTEAAGGILTRGFFGQLEHEGQPAEHLHIQKRRARAYHGT
jgi:hypothetical protein